MTRFFLATLTLLFLLAPGRSVLSQRILVYAGTVLDPGVSSDPLPERTIVIADGVIVAVVPGYATAKTADRVVDLKDQYVMPGWIDMHTHLSGESRKGGYIDKFRIPPERRALQAARYAKTTLLAGFTTIRDVGGTDGVDLALRDAINDGDVPGPRMFVAGKSLAITGGHADPTNGYREDFVGIPDESDGVVDGVASAIRATRMAVKRGADLIKITATGGVLSIAKDGSSAQFRDEEIRAIVETAAGFGLKVTAHAHGDEGMRRAVMNGVKSIEHGSFMSEETMAVMKEKGAYLIPTITAGRSVADSALVPGYYVAPVVKKALEIGPVIQGTFGRAYKAGVPIAFGTDAGVFKHGQNALEFGYMVEAGMPMMEAIASATINAATLLGQEDNLGTLEAGKKADLVAVPADPRQDAGVMTNVSFVMKSGVVYLDKTR